MKVQIQKNRIYEYYCDRCGRKISFSDDTMRQVHIQYSKRNSKKLCDLCNKCYESLERGITRKKG